MADFGRGGIIYLNIIKANDTLPMDLNGLSDPYTRIFLDTVQEAKTRTINETLNPVWNEQFCFFVPANSQSIVFEVWDKDLASSDDFMGRHEMPINFNDFGLHSKTVELGPKAGKKIKPGKKQKKRGTFTYEYQILPFGTLSKLLLDDYAHILEVVVTKTPHDKVAEALIGIFQGDMTRLFAMVKTALTYEIDQTLSSEQLFRTDSMATKLMRASSKLLGSLWLYDALYAPIQALCAANASAEIDPLKMEPGDDMEQNRAMVIKTSKEILEAVLGSFNKVPVVVQELVRLIATIVSTKFPESKTQAIGGYIFLRFFGPAISTPPAFGIPVQPSPPTQRLLILVTKVIQTIANNSGVREEFLQPLAPWIGEQQGIVGARLLELADGPNSSHPLPIPTQSSHSLLAHYGTLVDWLSNNQPVLERHGITPANYDDFKHSLAPYIRALSALPKDDTSSTKSVGSSGGGGLLRAKSKK